MHSTDCNEQKYYESMVHTKHDNGSKVQNVNNFTTSTIFIYCNVMRESCD